MHHFSTQLANRLGSRVARSKGLLSIGDQALISAGNFGTGVVLARALEPSAFGLYVVASVAIWFVLTLQNGLLLTPMCINGAALDDGAFRRFLRSSLPLQAALTVLCAIVVAAVSLAWDSLRPVAAPLTVVVVVWQAQEFTRRVLYTRGLMKQALVNNAMNYDAQVPILAAVGMLGGLNVASALWIIASTCLAATLLGAWQLRRFATHESDDLLLTARTSARVGKWTAPSSVFVAASTQWYPAMVSAIAGLPSAGVLGVINQLLNPLNLLTRPLESYYLPLGVRAFAHSGQSGLNRVLRRATLMLAPAYLVYVVIVMTAPALILRTLYGSAYAEYADILRAFALLSIVYIPVHLLGLELGSRRLQRYIFLATMWTAAEACLAGWFLILRFGLIGVAYATALGGLGQLILYAFWVVRARLHGRQAADIELAASRA